MFQIEIFQQRLKQLRERNQEYSTQKAFSDYIGITQQSLSGYEKGISKPPIDVLYTIAEKCNVSLDWLCGHSEVHRSADRLSTYSDVIEQLGFLTAIPELNASVEAVYSSFGNYAPYCQIQFECEQLVTFFNDWKSLLDLYRQGTIKEDLYKMWIASKLVEYNTSLKESEPSKTQKTIKKFEEIDLSSDEDLPF